jgi:hypothetical protein
VLACHVTRDAMTPGPLANVTGTPPIFGLAFSCPFPGAEILPCDDNSDDNSRDGHAGGALGFRWQARAGLTVGHRARGTQR